MCGIAGIISAHPNVVNRSSLEKMATAIAHRGPDSEGYWINSNYSIGLAHRLLTIMDISNSAAQPMHYNSTGTTVFDNRYTITYNGEIFNFREVRNQLKSKGYQFNTRSDAEVILAAFDCYKENCLEYFNGMFAFAIWDEKEQILFAARDRFGEKPFFYSYNKPASTLTFASEMKALWAAGVSKEIEEQALLYYLGLGLTYFPSETDRTFYKRIYALPPGHFLKWQTQQGNPTIQRYWSIDREHWIADDSTEATSRFKSLFYSSVEARLHTEVPLGISLSGGLDSSSIAGAMHGLLKNSRPQKSFSAVFPGFNKDESEYIRAAASAFGLDNYTVSPTASDLLDSLDSLCYFQEQPFGSASVFIQYKVYQLARQHGIKVLLDGQGADETIGGYTKYISWFLQETIRHKKYLHYRKEKRAFESHHLSFEWGIKNFLAAFSPKLASLWVKKRAVRKMNLNQEIENSFIRSFRADHLLFKPEISELNDILYHDTFQGALQELLNNADRNSMSQGIEVRLPYLDHKLVSFLFSLSSDYKMQQGYPKWILRESMKEKLPEVLAWRKDKIGFEPPQLNWMQEPLVQERIRDAKQKLVAAGILRRSILRTSIRPHSAYTLENHDWRYLIAATFLYQF